MIRTLESRILSDGSYYTKFIGLSTDTKPTENLATGSEFIEINATSHTITKHYWDEVNKTWIEAS